MKQGRKDIASQNSSIGKKSHNKKFKHGMSHHPLYRKYYSMMSRCYNKNYDGYKNYGAKGVTVCDEWKNNFEEFMKWSMDQWAPDLTLDRVDERLGYSPDNCRFITMEENSKRRRHNNKHVGKVFTGWRIAQKIPHTKKVVIKCTKCGRQIKRYQNCVINNKVKMCECQDNDFSN